MGNTVFKTPGPFSRIKAINFATIQRYCFKIIRDDGYEYTPTKNENITITLLTQDLDIIFQGESQLSENSQTINFSEGVTGLVIKYSYKNSHYHIELDAKILAQNFAIIQQDLQLFLTTNGKGTLTTIYNRSYHADAAMKLIPPGSYTITIPFWRITNQVEQFSLTTLKKTTTLFSSVPYRADFAIIDGQALANFKFPILGIVWRPTEDLSEWYGYFDIRDVCESSTTHAPWQFPDNVNRPTATPSSIYDRIYKLHTDVNLKISLSSCIDRWSDISINCSSNFGFSHQINHIKPGSELVNINQPISEFAKKISGKSFTLTAEMQWDKSGFNYSTGENPIFSNQTATLIASPVVDFDSITFQPLPE
ncbi:MAG: hypothetical protein HQL71_02935 [Magnetococcales bacterium]|nr:hypothetical protein [Magnetococcales bacterium]